MRLIPAPVDCILDAMLTVSPNKQYLVILLPTTPATHGPARLHQSSCSTIPLRSSDSPTCMDAYSEFNLALNVWKFLTINGLQDIEGHVCHFDHVLLTISYWNSTHHHVHASYCFHLENIWTITIFSRNANDENG